MRVFLFLFEDMITTNSVKTLLIKVSKPSVRLILSTLKSTFHNFEVVGVTQNIHDSLIQIESLQPNLIFLNFDSTGFYDHKQLDLIFSYKIPMIFVSKHAQYAQYAIKYSPIDYLVCPFSATDLNQALEKVKQLNQISNT